MRPRGDVEFIDRRSAAGRRGRPGPRPAVLAAIPSPTTASTTCVGFLHVRDLLDVTRDDVRQVGDVAGRC